jgi:hypothetical protein
LQTNSSLLVHDEQVVDKNFGQSIAKIFKDAQQVHEVTWRTLQQTSADVEVRYTKLNKSISFDVGQHLLMFTVKVPHNQYAKWTAFWRTE